MNHCESLNLESIYTLCLPVFQGTPCSKQAQYLKVKRLQQDWNPKPLSSEMNSQPLQIKWLWLQVLIQSLNSFMIILERSTSIVFFVHTLSSLKKLVWHDWGKDYTRLGWCLITLQNWQKRWKNFFQCNRFCFISIGVWAVSRFLFSKKTLGNIKIALR